MASKTDSTKVMWRIEYRKDRKSAWKKRPGLFETRKAARHDAMLMRWAVYDPTIRLWRGGRNSGLGYGFGNTRVVKYVRGGGR